MSVRVTGWGGIGEIGGNKLLLEDGDWHALLDFGKSFGAHARYFEEFLVPRTTAGAFDYLRTGLLPPLEGLYRPDLEALPEVQAFWTHARDQSGYREDVQPRAVLLSHAHQDHHGYLSFLKADIPIVGSSATALIVKGMQDCGQSGIESETVITRPRVVDGAVLSTERTSGAQRSWSLVDACAWTPEAECFWTTPLFNKQTAGWDLCGTAAFTGDIDGHRVRAYPVDHSIPGGHGFAIETSIGWIAYSGDIRMHGHTGDLTRQFAQELQSLDLELLICEGTQAASSSAATTEEEVRQSVHDAVGAADGLVVGDFSPRNFERLDTFLDAARHAGRQLVVLEKDAFLLHALATADPTTPLPDPARGPLIYRERRESPRAWSQVVAETYGNAMVDADEIARSPGEFVLSLSFYDVLRLLDIDAGGGTWIYSTSEPYNEEQVLDINRLRQWVDLLRMRMLGRLGDDPSQERFHASGHASGPDLLEFIEIARPRRLMPIHLEAEGLDFYRRHVPALGIELAEPAWGRAVEVRP